MNDSNDSRSTRALERARLIAARAQNSLSIVTRRFYQEFRLANQMSSEDMSRRVIGVVSRMTSHLAIIFVSVLALTLAGLRLGSADSVTVNEANPGERSGSVGRSPTVLVNLDGGGNAFGSGLGSPGSVNLVQNADGIIVREAAVDLPAAPGQIVSDASGAVASKPVEARNQIVTYRVQPGDAIETIARRFGLNPSTIVWSNQTIEDNPDLLKIGQELTILPVDGVYYTVKSGDSVAAIAKRFKTKDDDIVQLPLNGLGSSADLIAGVQIIVPGGVKEDAARPAVAAAPASRRLANPNGVSAGAGTATGNFAWPTIGAITQGFWSYHRAIDVANSIGTPVYASDGGYVSEAGWSPVGYGYMVRVEHGNGFSTLYAHLSYYYVEPGQYIAKGQTLGLMGSTGNSTGPHLHFEVRYGGGTQNPLAYLP